VPVPHESRQHPQRARTEPAPLRFGRGRRPFMIWTGWADETRACGLNRTCRGATGTPTATKFAWIRSLTAASERAPLVAEHVPGGPDLRGGRMWAGSSTGRRHRMPYALAVAVAFAALCGCSSHNRLSRNIDFVCSVQAANEQVSALCLPEENTESVEAALQSWTSYLGKPPERILVNYAALSITGQSWLFLADESLTLSFVAGTAVTLIGTGQVPSPEELATIPQPPGGGDFPGVSSVFFKLIDNPVVDTPAFQNQRWEIHAHPSFHPLLDPGTTFGLHLSLTNE
jgi:hypothetical protein